MLTNDSLQAGEAIQLECECRGDLALRHNTCAVKWAHVKGDNVCDICKQPIKNLPAITPRAPSEPGSDVDMKALMMLMHKITHMAFTVSTSVMSTYCVHYIYISWLSSCPCDMPLTFS